MEKWGEKQILFDSQRHTKFIGICFNASAGHFLNNLREDTVYFLPPKIIMAVLPISQQKLSASISKRREVWLLRL